MLATYSFIRRTLSSARNLAGLRSYATMFGQNVPLVVTSPQLQSMMAAQSSPDDLVVLDASWHMPNSPRKADEEFLASHIPSARFLEIDRVASPHPLSLPHMMPDSQTFVNACCKNTPTNPRNAFVEKDILRSRVWDHPQNTCRHVRRVVPVPKHI